MYPCTSKDKCLNGHRGLKGTTRTDQMFLGLMNRKCLSYTRNLIDFNYSYCKTTVLYFIISQLSSGPFRQFRRPISYMMTG